MRALFMLLALASAASAAERNPLDALRLEDLSATRDRPLFAPSRRPPPPVRVEAAPDPAPAEEKAIVLEPPPFDLVGAVVGKNTAFALLRHRTTAKVVRVRSGDDAEGWQVGAIGLRTVALARDGRSETLALALPQSVAAGPVIAGEPDPAEPAAPPPAAELKREGGKLRRER
ncbi:MAG: hypothetical protein KGM15_12755 [Pseudomonadota bacterium]|nr:hypothetical protein [Pseudomonadota bacterium]